MAAKARPKCLIFFAFLTVAFIPCRCQSFDGGFGSEPGNEAHGGYSFCGVASLVMLGKQKLCNTDRLLRWAVNRQMKLEGGFQGRPNKLVDGCYSFWQGGIFPILHEVMEQDGELAPLGRTRHSECTSQ